MTATTDNKRLVLGTVAGAYGVKGWVKIHSNTAPVENILKYSPWLQNINNHWQMSKTLSSKKHGKGLIAQLEGITDRDQAESLKGTEIAIHRDQLPTPEQGDFYWADLIGLAVVTTDAVKLGTVKNLMETGSNDVFVITGDDKDRLVPYIWQDIVKEIDLDSGIITVDWDPEF